MFLPWQTAMHSSAHVGKRARELASTPAMRSGTRSRFRSSLQGHLNHGDPENRVGFVLKLDL